MNIYQYVYPEAAVVEVIVADQLCVTSVPRWRQVLFDALSPGCTVVVDTSRVTAMDAAGVGVLMAARQQAHDVECEIALPAPSGAVRNAFTALGLSTDKVFAVSRSAIVAYACSTRVRQ